jgi:hypothetical protein
MRACRFFVLAVLCLVFAGGCAACQLRRNTVNQARTITDIHQQQVLNNLAMFVYNPDSLPCFAYPTQGTNQVVNITSGGYTQGFGAVTAGPKAGQFLLNSLGISLNGSHQSNEAFTMVPINDPRKLELMRCAYQTAVANCGRGSPSSSCPDCKARLNIFYTGEVDGEIPDSAKGAVTSECLTSECWFHVGCKKCVPKDCGCIYVGHYCGVYVWVLPQGRDELAKLTLAILDYAMHDPPVRLTKQVVYYIDELGLPTGDKNSVGRITATIPVNERSDNLLYLAPREASALEQQLSSQLEAVNRELKAELAKQPQGRSSGGGEQGGKGSPVLQDLIDRRNVLAAKLDWLKRQVDMQGLTNEFVPRDQTMLGPSSPGPISPNILQYNQLLNQIQQ